MCVLPRCLGASELPGQRQGFATVWMNGQIVGGKACERFVDSCIRQSRQVSLYGEVFIGGADLYA